MKKQLLSKYSLPLVLLIILTGLFSVIPSCGGGGGGSGPAPVPVPPPYTTASPVKGIYAAAQSVTLTANRPATIYYSLDGNMPSIGGANTISGPSPIMNIQISGDTNLLQYFAVDGSGVQESVKSETYVVKAGVAVGPGDIGNYFPLTVGSTWNSRVTVTETGSPPVTYNDTTIIDGSKVINGIIAVNSREVNPNNTWYPLNEYLLKSSKGVVYLGNSDLGDIQTPQIVPYHFIHFPLQTGARFAEINISGLDYGDDIDWDGQNETLDVDSKITIKGYESVTVPAGTFPNSAIIERDLAYTVIISSDNTKVVGRGVDTMWLAPGIGFVKSVSKTTESYLNDTFDRAETEELISAIVPAPFFGSPTSFATGTSPSAMAIGDFNGDGKPDLAVTNEDLGWLVIPSPDSTVSVLLGDGTGFFGAATDYVVGALPESVTVGDFNNDGKQDLAVANYASYTVSILLSTSTGTFWAATNYVVATQTNPTSVATGDFNGDGNLDIAVVNSYGSSNATPGYVAILLGNGAGSFGAPANFGVGGVPGSVVVGDFNKDGKLDLAVANTLSNTVSILLGTGTGSFGAATNIPVDSYPGYLAVGDFNNDGKLDLAVANNNNQGSGVAILLGNGVGSFIVSTRFAVDPINGADLYSLAVGDFNGDGKLDVAVGSYRHYFSSAVIILLGDGTGSFNPTAYFIKPANDFGGRSSVAVGDFNVDGKPDLAVTYNSYNVLDIFLNANP